MGKAAQIITSVTGITRRKAELAEHHLKSAGLLVTEEETEAREIKEVKTTKAEKTEDKKEVSEQ